MIGQQAEPAPPAAVRDGAASESLQTLATLHRLTLEAGLSATRQQLIFRILNHSVAYCHYDRAVLWDLKNDRRPRLLGVSGACDVNRQAPLVVEWRRVVRALPDLHSANLIEAKLPPAQRPAWERLAARTSGLSAVWLPIKLGDRAAAGLWLERWGGRRFTARDVTRLEALALGYQLAWRGLHARPGCLRRLLCSRRGVLWSLVLVLALGALVLVPVPLRIVAPCEVVPKDPLAITAPLAGVIEEVTVLPGRQVSAGELLAVYDKRVALEELKVARQQVQIVESDLQRARVQAFDKAAARAEIALLENRLEQEKTRLRIAEYRAERLEIRAPIAGTLMFSDPNEWRGRPVQVGERLMLLVDPQRTKVRIWLPQHDNIRFDSERPLRVILHSEPGQARAARLCFLANHSQTGPDGQARFRAEAEWLEPARGAKLGLQGSAILYGEDVPLGYWLLRRPLASARRFLGI